MDKLIYTAPSAKILDEDFQGSLPWIKITFINKILQHRPRAPVTRQFRNDNDVASTWSRNRIIYDRRGDRSWSRFKNGQLVYITCLGKQHDIALIVRLYWISLIKDRKARKRPIYTNQEYPATPLTYFTITITSPLKFVCTTCVCFVFPLTSTGNMVVQKVLSNSSLTS